jgi:hypothetical protein
MHSIHKGRLAAMGLLLGLAVVLGLWASGVQQTKAALATPYIRIQGPGTASPVPVGGNFDIEVWLDSGTTAFNTYQVELDVPTGTSWMSGTHETSPFTNCYVWPTGPIAGPVAEATACGKSGDQTYGTPEKKVETLTLRCDAAGTYNLNLEDATDDPSGGTYLIDVVGPVTTNTTPDGQEQVKCVNPTNIIVSKSDSLVGGPPPVAATGTGFTYTIVAQNDPLGVNNAIGLVVADTMPDIADADGRGMKLLNGTPLVAVDTTGDTLPDYSTAQWPPAGPLPCQPGFLGVYPNPFPPPVNFNSLVACSGFVESVIIGAPYPPILDNLPPGDSVIVTVPVVAPAAEAGFIDTNLAQGVLDCVPPPNGLGDPNCTFDANPANEADCALIAGLPNANLGCDLMMSAPVNIASFTKVPDVSSAKDGETINWTLTATVGAGSAATNPVGEAGGAVSNCWDNADNDSPPDGNTDFDGGGGASPDPACQNAGADWGPVITDVVTNQTIPVIDSSPACREAGGVPAITGGPTTWNIKCSLVSPVAAGGSAQIKFHTTAVAPSAPADCADNATLTYASWDYPPTNGGVSSAPASGHVSCQPRGVMDHKDKGVAVFPPVVDVLVGSHANVIVAETLEIVDAGPTPVLVHNWNAGSAVGDGVLLHWADKATPPTDGWDVLTFTTSGHINGLITLSKVLEVSCTAADGEKTVDLALESTGAKDIWSYGSLIVQCFDQPQEVKVPASGNLWLMRHPNCGPENLLPPCNPEEGKGSILIKEQASAIANGHGDPGGMGAYEKQIKYDHKLFLLDVEDAGYLGSTNRTVNCTMTIVTENWITFGCVTTGTQDGPSGSGPVTLTTILVKPQPDLFLRLHPTKNNGVVSTIIDENCEWADILGNPMAGMVNGGLVPVCTDSTITIRMLEGDLNNDCNVDVLDEQGIAFRYGATFGLQLYNAYYDLEPQTGDFDIDIKDLQFVFGREGSTCQAPIPAQPPSAPPP